MLPYTGPDALYLDDSGTEDITLIGLSGLEGVRLIKSSGTSGSGIGYLRTTEAGTKLQYKAPGSDTFGPAEDISYDRTCTVTDGEDGDKWVRVEIFTNFVLTGTGTSTDPAVGTSTGDTPSTNPVTSTPDSIASTISTEYYNKAEIDAMFEGKTAGGKQKVDWDNITNKGTAEPTFANLTVTGTITTQNLTASGTVTGDTLTDGTMSITNGNITGAGSITATTFTDGTITITGGVIATSGSGISVMDDVCINGSTYIQSFNIYGASTSYMHFFTDSTGDTISDGCDIGVDSSSVFVFVQRENAAMKFLLNGSEWMRLQSGGEWGLGIAAPVQKGHIHASGSSYLHWSNSTTGVTSADGFDIGIPAGSSRAVVWQREDADLWFGTNGILRWEIEGNGTLLGQGHNINMATGNITNATKVTIGGVVLSGAGSDNFVVNDTDNTIETGCNVSVIGGGGASAWPNLIGSTGLPNGADFTPTGWSADTGYVTGSADISLISGGYDHIQNQLAGVICGGGHNFMKYDVNAHSFIGGGSYNVMAAGRSVIVGGRRNTITGASIFSNILGGDDNNIVGNFSSILGGEDTDVTNSYACAFGRRAKGSGQGSLTFCDSTNADFTNSTQDMFAARYSGGYWFTGGNFTLEDSASVAIEIKSTLLSTGENAALKFFGTNSGGVEREQGSITTNRGTILDSDNGVMNFWTSDAVGTPIKRMALVEGGNLTIYQNLDMDSGAIVNVSSITATTITDGTITITGGVVAAGGFPIDVNEELHIEIGAAYARFDPRLDSYYDGANSWALDCSAGNSSSFNLKVDGTSESFWQATTGQYVMRTSTGGNAYFDVGGTWEIRDVDASNTTRVSINSANGDIFSTGNLELDTTYATAATQFTMRANSNNQMATYQHTDTWYAGYFEKHYRSRGSESSQTVLSDGDRLYTMELYGHDGTDLNTRCGRIIVAVDGSVSNNIVPIDREYYLMDNTGSEQLVLTMKYNKLLIGKDIDASSYTVTGNTLTDGTITITGGVIAAGGSNVAFTNKAEFNGGIQIDGAVSGTKFKDEDDMASDSADSVASQQSIKAYVDNNSGITVIRKDADQSHNATNYVDLTQLQFSVDASSEYWFEFLLFVNSLGNTNDFNYKMDGPTGMTLRYEALGRKDDMSLDDGDVITSIGSVRTLDFDVAGNNDGTVSIRGTLETGANSGTIKIQFAVNNDIPILNVTVKEGSYMKYRKL